MLLRRHQPIDAEALLHNDNPRLRPNRMATAGDYCCCCCCCCKVTWIGGLDHVFSRMLGVSSTSAAKTASEPPIMRLIRHMMARCSGSYLALPEPTWMWQRAVLDGTGTYHRGRRVRRETLGVAGPQGNGYRLPPEDRPAQTNEPPHPPAFSFIPRPKRGESPGGAAAHASLSTPWPHTLTTMLLPKSL